MQSYDVIVAGGGWGGLGTAALLSARGARVLLLEGSPQLGGRASFLERDGFQVDFGIHAHRFAGSGAASELYGELGIELELIPPASGVVEYRGRTYPAPLKARRFATSRILDRRSEFALLKGLRPLLKRPADELYDTSVRDALPPDTGKDTRDFISALAGLGLVSQDLSRTSAGEFAWFLRKAARSVNHLIAFPRNGCKQHVSKLSSVVKQGGVVQTGCRVRRVRLENGTVTGVESEDRAERARAVVLAVPGRKVAPLLPEGSLSLDSVLKLARPLPSAGLSWDVGLARPVSDVQVAFCIEPLIIGAFPSNYDPLLCSPGRQLSTWCMPLSLSDFHDRDALRRESGAMRRKVFHMFPGLEENILWERMLHLPVIDGAVPHVGQAWPSRQGVTVEEVDGLFLAGDTVGVPGEGGDIAFRSAIECSARVMEYLER